MNPTPLKRKHESSDTLKSQILLQNQLSKSQFELQQAHLRLNQLEKDREFLYNKNTEYQETIHKQTLELQSLEQEKQSISSQFQVEQSSLSDNLLLYKSKYHSIESSLSIIKTDYESEIEVLKNRIQNLQELLERKSQALIARNNELESLSHLPHQVSTSGVTQVNQDKQDWESMQKQFKANVEYIHQLESKIADLTHANKQYKQMDLNMSKKDEQMKSLSSQLIHMAQLKTQIAHLQVENSSLQSEKAKWSKYVNSNEMDPLVMSRSLAKERLQFAELKNELGLVKAEICSKDHAISQLNESLVKLQSQTLVDASNVETLEKKLALVERSKALAQREAKFLKSQLESFDLEESLANPSRFDSKKSDLIQELNSLLEEYKSLLNQQSCNNIKEKSCKTSIIGVNEFEKLQELKQTNQEYKKEISDLKIENGMLNKTISSLEDQISELQMSTERIQGLRILEFKDNPAALSERVQLQELKALKSENEALLKVQLSSQQHGGLPLESLQVFELKVSELQNELLNKEKRMARLKEVLNARVQEFRESICCILGYKVDLQPQGTLRFTSIYAPERHFEFDSRGSLLSMGIKDGNANDLQEGISRYLERDHVPAFMGWLTCYFHSSPE